MDNAQDIIKDIWFGEKQDIFYNAIHLTKNDKSLYGYLVNFVKGDFSRVCEFVDFFVHSKCPEYYNIGMRIFLSIAKHADFEFLQKDIEHFDEDRIRVFLAFVQESMSYYAIPYLLALMDIWESTEFELKISQIIGEMIRYEKAVYEQCSPNELGDAFVTFSSLNDLSRYFYKGQEVFAGDLSKVLMEVALSCHNQKRVFYTNQIPSILSKMTGIKCPVQYATIIDSSKIQELFAYVQQISTLNLEKGRKYFYGNLID